jgi:hypothetical protein
MLFSFDRDSKIGVHFLYGGTKGYELEKCPHLFSDAAK